MPGLDREAAGRAWGLDVILLWQPDILTPHTKCVNLLREVDITTEAYEEDIKLGGGLLLL